LRRRFLLPLLMLVALPAWGQAAVSSEVLTLPDAVRRALEANLALQRSHAEVNASEQQRRSIVANVLPKISLLGTSTQNSEEVSFGTNGDARTILPGSDWSYALAFTQPVFAGLREKRALQQARLGVETARQAVVDTEDQVLTTTVAQYFGVLEGEALLEVERKNLELSRGRHKQAQDFFEAGETTRVEVLRAESDIKGAERRIAAAQQVRDTAESQLRLVLGLGGAPGSFAVADPVPLFPQLPPEAERLRPEVAQAATALEVARLEILKQRGALLPVVAAEGGWINQRSTFPSDQYGFITLRMAVPLYQGGEVAAKTAQARERHHQAELQLEEVKQTVREEVRMALVDLRTADANLRLSREQLAAAEAEHEQASELYRAQETTALDAEAAETSLADARRAVVVGELLRSLAELKVWSTAGLLKKTLIPEEIPEDVR
jgi:outer membrane protein